MATYVKIQTSQIDADSPLLETLGQQISDNFENLNDRVSAFDSGANESIRTEFGSDSIDTNIWDLNGNTTPVIIAPHQARVQADGTANHYGVMSGKNTKIRPNLAYDQTLTFDMRFKRSGAGGAKFFFGLQDAAVNPALTNIYTDQSDCIAFLRGAGTNFNMRVAKGGAATTASGDFGNIDNWTRLRMVVTVSGGGATLSVDAYADEVQIGGLPITTNIPNTVVLMPILMAYDTGAGLSMDARVDRCDCYWNTRPTAP